MTGTKRTWRFVVVVVFVALMRPPWRVSRQAQQPAPQPPTQAPQMPVFRGGTHFVRVHTDPTTMGGRILEGLKPEDVEIVEAGRPQTLESFEMSEDSVKKIAALDVSLSGLRHGDYLFELTVGSEGGTERHLRARRVTR